MPASPQQRTVARLSFGRLMRWTAATAIGAILVALYYLHTHVGAMPIHMVVATILGVGFTVMLAGGLTALCYLSANSGSDDHVGSLDD